MTITMKAARLLAANVAELLAREHQSQKDLAQWCRHTETWVSQFLKGERDWRLEDLDRVADMWGLRAYQLFIPGIAARSERRTGHDRRQLKERRIGSVQRAIFHVAQELDHIHPRRRGAHAGGGGSELDKLSAALKREIAATEQRLSALLQAAAHAGEQAADPGDEVPKTRKSDRRTGGSDAGAA
jgi:hypothetical protein